MQNSIIHLTLSGLGLVTAFVMVIFSIVLTVNVLNKGCDSVSCPGMVYITTTFLSSRRIETNLGFPVATERDLTDSVQNPINDPVNAIKDKNYRFGHFYECMYTARMADKTCSPSLSLNDYTVCIQNTTALSTGLDNCAAFPSVGGYSHWPTSEEYLACLWNNPLLQNSEVRRASQNVFRACIEQTLWPFFEVPQTIDSPYIFGSFNWGVILLTGMVVLSSFVVYTSSPVETGKVERGEVQPMMRLGLFSSGLALVWNIIFFIIFLTVAFKNGNGTQDNTNLPITASTMFVSIVGLGAAVLYFLSVVMRPAQRSFVAILYSNMYSDVATIECVEGDVNECDHESHGSLLKATFPENVGPEGVEKSGYTLSDHQVTTMYTPPMLAIWSDSYMLDFCFFLGITGATGQLSTDVAWTIFSVIFVYRILGMIISRCMSDAFMNNVRLSKDLNKYKNHIRSRTSMIGENRSSDTKNTDLDVHLSPKVIGLSTQLASLFLYLCVLYIFFNENSVLKDYTYVNLLVYAGFVIPEVLRLLIHLYYQVAYNGDEMGKVPWFLYNSAYFIFLWDVIFRLLAASLVILESNNTPGTFDYLKTQTGALMRDYVVAFSA